TFAPDGTLYAYRIPTSVDTKPGPAALVKVDTATGAQVVVGDLPVMFNGGMTFDAAGNLWLYSFNPTDPSTSGCSKNFCLWKVNPANADATLVGGQDTRFVGGLAATCTEVQAGTQVATGPAPISRLDRVDTATADLFKIVDLKGVGGTTGLDVNQTSGLDYDATGVLWGVGLSALTGRTPLLLSAVFRVDPATGVTATATLTLDNSDFLGQVFGLAVAGLACAAPAAVELQPLFTG
ncbi:MAG: hypothetical protein MUP97_17250, partial [Acidimicrobiia bacterium]|nr:hypothetical protein [Acidimicrobiia bacterium]